MQRLWQHRTRHAASRRQSQSLRHQHDARHQQQSCLQCLQSVLSAVHQTRGLLAPPAPSHPSVPSPPTHPPHLAQSRVCVRVSAVATTAKKDAAATSSKLASSLTPEVAKDLYYDMVSGPLATSRSLCSH